MDVFLLILRLALAAVFAVAGFAKLFDREGAQKAFGDFGVPAAFRRPLASVLPAVELIIAILLLPVESSWVGSIGAASVLLVFTAGMVYQLTRGNSPDCHCFGQLHSAPVGVGSIVRNTVLLAAAAFLFSRGAPGQGLNLIDSNQNVMQFVLGVAVVALLAVIIFSLKRISGQQTEIMRRIELMELVARDGGFVTRDDIGHPNEGLPIGALVPDFELPGLDGEAVSLADLKTGGKPVLFFFISPTCAPCRALVPEFEQWQSDLADHVSLVFVSSGKSDENLEKFGGDRSKQILLQKEREVAGLVRAQWTPTAVLMDANGRIESHLAAGDSAIRSLVGQLAARDPAREFTYFTNGNGHSHPIRIGDAVPEFSARDIRGNEIDSRYFQGNQTLVAFWSLTCPHCLAMMDGLSEWDKIKGKDEPALVVFSDGERAAHEEIDLRSPIILDEGHKIAVGFGMSGTPSAVLVNEHGRIISETAIGAPNIWSLVGKKYGI